MKQLILTKKDIIAINQQFSNGYVMNEPSLDYALNFLKQDIGWIKQLAYLLRAILLDHIFEDGNKRTAVTLLIFYTEYYQYKIDNKKALDIIKWIVLKNKKDIKYIIRRIENAVEKD